MVVARLPPGLSPAVKRDARGCVAIGGADERWLSLPGGIALATPPGEIGGAVRRAPWSTRLIETIHGAAETRTVWWEQGAERRKIRDRVPDDVRFEIIGDGLGVLVDPDPARLAVLHIDGREATFELPGWLELSWTSGDHRQLWHVADPDVLVLQAAQALAWIPVGQIRELLVADSVTWRPRTVAPFGERDARVAGSVLFASDTLTMISAGSQRVTIRARTGCAKGEAVTLAGALWDGAFETLVRADGTRLHIAPFPELATVEGRRAAGARTAGVDGELRDRAVAALRWLRKTGIGRDLDGPELDELLDGVAGASELADAVFQILRHHWLVDEARAIRDGYFEHDWRFDPADAAAHLAARAGAGALPEPGGAVETLDDLVAASNRSLERAGDERRFHALETDGDWHAYLLLTPATAERIRRDGLLPLC